MSIREPLAGSARSLLLTLLGEFVLVHGNAVWTSALLYVMTGLGREKQTARQTIARAADAGLIAGDKHGRTVSWTVTASGKSHIEDIARRAGTLIKVPERWDGRCIVLAVTVPERLKGVRKGLYSALRWQGFGNPAPGLWASAHVDRVEELSALIDDLGLRDSTITFIGGTLGVGLTDPEIVRRAWDLDAIAARYHRLIERFAEREPKTRDDLLFSYVALVNEYHQFPAMDPQLPEDLLPDWVGREATAMFIRLHRAWSVPAHERWLEIVSTTTPKHAAA